MTLFIRSYHFKIFSSLKGGNNINNRRKILIWHLILINIPVDVILDSNPYINIWIKDHVNLYIYQDQMPYQNFKLIVYIISPLMTRKFWSDMVLWTMSSRYFHILEYNDPYCKSSLCLYNACQVSPKIDQMNKYESRSRFYYLSRQKPNWVYIVIYSNFRL